MWEFYLAGCEMAFRNGRMMVFQIQLARERDAVPVTRDFIADQERRFEAMSRGHGSASAVPARPIQGELAVPSLLT